MTAHLFFLFMRRPLAQACAVPSPLSAAIALNIGLRICLTVATPFDRMACKVKSWLSQQKTRHAKRRGDLLKPPMAGESLC
jgi:hypothetical protein